MPTISAQWRKARKSYPCGHCYDNDIRPGDRYLRLYGYAEPGDPPFAVRLCETCGQRQQEAEDRVAKPRLEVGA